MRTVYSGEVSVCSGNRLDADALSTSTVKKRLHEWARWSLCDGLSKLSYPSMVPYAREMLREDGDAPPEHRAIVPIIDMDAAQVDRCIVKLERGIRTVVFGHYLVRRSVNAEVFARRIGLSPRTYFRRLTVAHRQIGEMLAKRC